MLNPHIVRKTVDPTTAPPEAGIHWINTVTNQEFFSVGTSSVVDWIARGVGSSGVTSFNTRTGIVVPTVNDYLASQIKTDNIIGSPTDMLTVDRVLDHAWSAGITDGAVVTNNGNGTVNLSIANVALRQSFIVTITRSGSIATVTHPIDTYITGDNVYIYGAIQPEYNGKFVITVVNSTTFTYPVTGTPATPATGTIVSVNEHARMQIMTVPSVTNISFTDHAVTFIYVDYNAGSPIYATTQTISSFDGLDKVIAYKIAREGNTLYITDARAFNVDGIRKNGRRLLETQGFQHVLGGSAISHIGTRSLYVTSGAFYYGVNKITHNTFNTSSTDTFTSCYQNGSGGWTYTSGLTQVSNLNYDNGSGSLATLTNNNYGVFSVYMMVDSPCSLMIQYGQGDYNTLSLAQSAPIASPPPIVSGSGILIGRIIIKKSATSFADISSAFGTQFTPSVATNHESLSGLLGGAIDDHYHITAVQAAVVANTSGTNTGDQYIETTYSRVITSGEIAASQLTLSSTPPTPSLVKVNISGGCVQIYGTDYTVSGSTLSWSALGMATVISTGDYIQITY